jgi:hypothetical protein
VHESIDDFDREKFLYQLNRFEGNIVLFGGEVTTNIPRMIDIYKNNKENGISKINSVSTNLTILNGDLLKIYREIGVSTSWNPNRFSEDEYYKWLINCQTLSYNNIGYIIMITLTEDLFKINPVDFIALAKTWITDNLRLIKFEHYVGDENTPEYFERADNWLCELYDLWNIDIKFQTAEKACNWKMDCSEIYTLLPNGELKHQCPHSAQVYTPVECYTCDRVEICRPCRLQKYCSFPKKFAEKVKSKIGEV